MKSLRDRMDVGTAYGAEGSYRSAAALCGTMHRTVKRMLKRRQANQVEPRVDQSSRKTAVISVAPNDSA